MALRAVGSWGVVAAFLGAACGASSRGGEPRELHSGGDCSACAGEASVAGQPSSGGASGGAGEPSVPENPGGAPLAEPMSGAAGEAGQAGQPGAPPPDVTLAALTISQTLEIPLMKGGAEVLEAERSAPLVAGKRALVRAFVEVLPGFRARSLLGVLDLGSGENTRSLVSDRAISVSSQQDDLGSSFVFELPPGALTPDTNYRLRVLEADTTPLVRFPEQGYAKLNARSLPAFELVIVPFIIQGFAPKTGEVELDALRRRLLALYPSIGVNITRAPPLTIDYPVTAEGDGWDDALDAIYELRTAARPAHDVFYFGMMAPAASYDAFCPEGCTVGYSVVADANDADSRGSIGVGVFSDGSGGEDAWDTLAHELGHALGREHAPCPAPPSPDRPDYIDPDWPEDPQHKGGMIGGYGYDFDAARLIKPRPAKDVMSYCTPIWISDYTYSGIFDRLDYIQKESMRVLALEPRELLRLARISRDGRVRWLGDRYKQGRASAREVELLDAAGKSLGKIQAQVALLDHARGGYVWLTARELRESGAASVDLRQLGGGVLPL